MLQPGLEEEIHVRDPDSEPEPDERLERILSEVRGRRYRDLTKDTQFTDAWVIVGLILTVVGLALATRFLLVAAVACSPSPPPAGSGTSSASTASTIAATSARPAPFSARRSP